jgi:ribonuclease Z
MIDIAFLGTGAMMPTSERWLSSMLIRLGDELMLFDAGEGVQIPWREQGWGIKRLSFICLSHHHADHIAGIPGVLLALANAGREEPVTIVGPRGTRALVTGLREAVPVLPYDLQVADLGPGTTWPWNGLRMTVVPGLHRIPVLLYRFELARAPAFLAEKATQANVPRRLWTSLADGNDVVHNGANILAADFHGPARAGISFGVMTDTRPTEVAKDHFREVDLLITEGTYGDDADADNAQQNRHMTFREAGQFAAEAGVKRLIVTHFSPKMTDPAMWIANGQAAFPSFELAQASSSLTLKFPR